MSVLKKEFKKQDVERIRNLVKGKYGDKTRSSVGFTKKTEFHKEGDIWESDGRFWTIKDGIKQNVTKLDKAKKAYALPLFCPKCSQVMKKKFDKQFYNVHKMCFDCVIDKENELKKNGKWEEYEKGIINDEIDNRIKDYKLWVEEKLNQSNEGYVTEAGDIEKWGGKINKELAEKGTQEVIDFLESLKK